MCAREIVRRQSIAVDKAKKSNYRNKPSLFQQALVFGKEKSNESRRCVKPRLNQCTVCKDGEEEGKRRIAKARPAAAMRQLLHEKWLRLWGQTSGIWPAEDPHSLAALVPH